MNREYEIGKWTKDTCMIIRDKDDKVLRHYIYVYNRLLKKKGIYDLVLETFTPIDEKKYIEKWLIENNEENIQFIDTGIMVETKGGIKRIKWAKDY